MPSVEQQIKVIVTFESNVNKMKAAINAVEKLRESGAKNNEQADESLSMLASMDEQLFFTAQKQINYEKKIKATNLRQREAASISKKMTGTYLSLMFASMALSRTFGGLAKSMFDILGVSKVWKAVMTNVLLPVFLPLSQHINKFLISLMGLPTPIKTLIGWVVVLVGVLAGIGVIFFGLNLAAAAWATFLGIKIPAGASALKVVMASLWKGIYAGAVWLWGGIVSIFTAIGSVIGVTAGVAAAIVAAIIVVIIGAIAAWKNNFLGFKDAIIGYWNAIVQTFQGAVQALSGLWNILAGIFTGNFDRIKQGFALLGKGILNMFAGIVNQVISLINGFVSLLIASLAQVVRLAQWAWNKVPGHNKVTWYDDIMAWGKDKTMIPNIPSFKTGGVMPYDGVANLHAGETIIPAGQNLNSAPTINISANISNDYDVRRLADQLSKYWVSDMERISKSRGMI